jgi:hypothetical protein
MGHRWLVTAIKARHDYLIVSCLLRRSTPQFSAEVAGHVE